MRYQVRTVTAASLVPALMTTDEAKKQVRIEAEETTDDDLIAAQLRAATDHVERFTGQVLTPRTMELLLDRFPCLPELIEIPRSPVTAITSVKYSDPSTGGETVMDGADWRWSDSDPELIRPAFSANWPSAAAERGSVRIRFEAGYDEGLAPPALVEAVKRLLGHFYMNREAVVTGTIATELPIGVADLCRSFRRLLI